MEIPSITASSYVSSTLDSAKLFLGHAGGLDRRGEIAPDFQKIFQQAAQQGQLNPQVKAEPMSTARIVKVFIADSNENLPLDKRVLHSGSEQLTDLTDQELFFEVPIADILAKHNDVRKVTVDKKQAEKFGRDIYLEPARIRDLKMVVVTVAQF